MTGLDGLTPDLAQRILERMGSTGQPPERGALCVNVATTAILDTLKNEYIRPIGKSTRGSTFKLVQAPFGGGKTHFLHCLREVAWHEGFATAIVGLSPKECPFDRPVSIYQEVARRLTLPVPELDIEPNPGIRRTLRQVARDLSASVGERAFLDWLRAEFSEATVESTAYCRAVRQYLEAVVGDDREVEEVLGDYRAGESVDGDDLRKFRLRERLTDDCGFRWLRSLAQCLAALRVPGLVLMFDEMDRNMSLSVRRRRDIGDNLRQMIDYCGQSLLPNVILCYAVPPEFLTTVVPEYPALQQRLKGATAFSAVSPMQPIIDLDVLPMGPSELLKAIGSRLLAIAERGHEHRFDRAIQEQNLAELARELGDNQFESGTRRTFVKAAVTLLDEQRRDGDKVLSSEEIRQRAGTAGAAVPEVMLGEEEF